MPERRHLCEQLGLDVLAGDEEVDRGRVARSRNEILPFDDEQPELVAPAPVMELADELEPLVVAGSDQPIRIRVRLSPARRPQ
jgi:hypothetical protein